MRVLLINPQYPIDETPSPPLGLGFIAAVLEQAGIEVKLLDFVVFPYSRKILEYHINRFSPDVVGATCVTMSFDNAIRVIRDAKNINPEIATVMGGPHVSFNVEPTLSAFPELDVIVRGEGENTIVHLVKSIEQNTDFAAVEGIAFRNGEHIHITGSRKPVDINRLPLPARHHIPLGRYRALGMPVSMTSSRGCPFQCIFCVGRKMVGAGVRYRNPVSVADEMSQLSRMGFHQINLADDLFTANTIHCTNVCDAIINRGLNVQWTSFARVDTVSGEILKKMKAAGCHTVSFGVESGNPEMLKRIKKGITRRQVIDAVRMCLDAGLSPQASFILGLPGETPETMQDSIEFGQVLRKMGVQHGFHILAPFPGTEIRENIDRYDLKILTNDWRRYHANRAVVETSAVNAKMMNDIVIGWEEKYDLHLRRLAALRKNGGGTADELWPLTRLEHTVLIYDLFMDRTIERLKPFSPADSDEAFILQLANLAVRTYEPQSKRTCGLDAICRTLTFAVEQNYLTYTRKNGGIKWEWADYINEGFKNDPI
ncbi:MAG: radical SAM protein [Desulfobacterales bacterium]